MGENNGVPRKRKSCSLSDVKKQQLVFYWLVMALPLLQFIFGYLYVNFNSFALAFRRFDYGVGGYVFNGFGNFRQFIDNFYSQKYLMASVWNSLEIFVLVIVFGSFGSILFSYYIFKNHPGSALFKVILYTPHIISTVVIVVMYKYFMEDAMVEIFKLKEGLIANVGTRKSVIMFFTIWVGFGTQVLMYSGAMSGISDSVIESAKLDGITPLREVVFIVVPMIWPTFVTFMVVNVANLFTNQMSLYSFYGGDAPYELYTFGYFLYAQTIKAGMAEYSYLSACGLLMTLIAVPLTLLTRFVLEKFGPKTT